MTRHNRNCRLCGHNRGRLKSHSFPTRSTHFDVTDRNHRRCWFMEHICEWTCWDISWQNFLTTTLLN